MKAKGKAIRLGDNIDTDLIIAARYLSTADPHELAKHFMEDYDETIVSKISQGDIVVAGKNFGCGSSREHAPIAIKGAGISCVIAENYARIFYRNSFNIGLPIIESKEASEKINDGDKIKVDFSTGEIENITQGEIYKGEAYPDFIQNIIKNGGLVEYVKQGGKTRMKFKISVAKGDGVGPEVVDGAITVLNRISEVFGHEFEYIEFQVGGAAYDKYNHPLPEETIEKIKESDAVLFGAVGGDKWDHLPRELRPEQAILGLRKALNVYSNIRPGILFPALSDASPLKKEIVKDGFDICVVRELVGGIYFGEKGRTTSLGVEEAFDVERYNEIEIERIARSAFRFAMRRRLKITSVDKANVLESSRLWRTVVERVWTEFPMVELNHLYIDNAAMQLIKDPNQFDVILTSNIFGDILSDEISMLTGSIGLLPSASIGEGRMGIYEPIHGSAPDIQGKNIANPVGTILSAAMMLEYSFDLKDEAEAIRDGVNKVFELGYGTRDIRIAGIKILGTKEMAELIAKNIS